MHTHSDDVPQSNTISAIEKEKKPAPATTTTMTAKEIE